MRYIDRIVDISFKTMEDGTIIYYPYGILGKGYVLPNDAKKQEIRQKLKISFTGNLGFLLLFPIITTLATTNRIPDWLAALMILGITGTMFLYSYFITVRWVKGLPPAKKGLTIAERIKIFARSYNKIFLWWAEISALLLTLFTVFILLSILGPYRIWFFRPEDPIRILIFILTLAGLPCWILCMLVYGYMIKSKNSK